MQRTLPCELIHEIIATFCGEYIDSLIQNPDGPPELNFQLHKDGIQHDSTTNTSPDEVVNELPVSAIKPIINLLETSSQVRELTLSTLSLGMSIPRDEDGGVAKKVWSTVQALRAQLFESSFNEANLCPPTPFFACYTLAAMIPISFFGVLCSEEEKRDKIDVDYVAGINSLAVSHRRRMAPEAFVRPALRQTKHWTWVMGFMMPILFLELAGVVAPCLVMVHTQDEAERSELFESVLRSLKKLRELKFEQKLPGYFLNGVLVSEELDFDLFRYSALWSLSGDIESIRHLIDPSDYATCRALIADILQYWTARYPQLDDYVRWYEAQLEAQQQDEEDAGDEGDNELGDGGEDEQEAEGDVDDGEEVGNEEETGEEDEGEL
ncbi:hypothetical protein NLI96_g12328 [Meripilus lineatus]|uniref:Uncharacterized protein n=1 Tax=Meripilus lineatus TaxID=2056292 RepID=A0AAD5UU31_9APHY|nr:hypothetical protein NLI96_g12328 [Physisporinus lineatus]